MTASIRHGRFIVVAVAAVGVAVLLVWGVSAVIRAANALAPILALTLWAAGCRSLWRGDEVARRRLIAVLATVALLGAFATAVIASVTVLVPVGALCGIGAALLAGRAVGTFLRHQRSAAG